MAEIDESSLFISRSFLTLLSWEFSFEKNKKKKKITELKLIKEMYNKFQQVIAIPLHLEANETENRVIHFFKMQ